MDNPSITLTIDFLAGDTHSMSHFKILTTSLEKLLELSMNSCIVIVIILKNKHAGMKSLEEIKKFLQENKEIILKEFKAEIVGIFGSYARGEQTRESDIDIVVRFREGATLFDLVELAEFLEHKLGIKVDIVSERAVRPELKESILKEIVAT